MQNAVLSLRSFLYSISSYHPKRDRNLRKGRNFGLPDPNFCGGKCTEQVTSFSRASTLMTQTTRHQWLNVHPLSFNMKPHNRRIIFHASLFVVFQVKFGDCRYHAKNLDSQFSAKDCALTWQWKTKLDPSSLPIQRVLYRSSAWFEKNMRRIASSTEGRAKRNASAGRRKQKEGLWATFQMRG